MVFYKKGNLLKSPANYLCHQVNLIGVMGAGIANQIKEKWPKVYSDYVDGIQSRQLGDVSMTLVGEKQAVVNFFSQNDVGTASRKTNYEAFYKCLETLHNATKPTSVIAFPYKIGCGLGGGSWEIIENMIKTVLKDREVYIYYLEDDIEQSPFNQAKVINYCCTSAHDMSDTINKFYERHPLAEIINFSSSCNEMVWFLTIFYKE